MQGAGAPTVSVVIPATNGPPTLPRCIEAMRSGSTPPDELVVVSEPPGASPAAARNEGALRARGEVLVFVDADVLVHPDALARIEAAFDADAGLTAVFGSYDDRPEAPGVVSAFRNLLHHHVHQCARGPAQTFWAGLGAVRRDAFLAAGGFDELQFPRSSIEDVELGMRLTTAGARIDLDPGVQGTHLKAWSLGEMVRTDFARRGVPWVRLLLRRREVPSGLNLGWRHRASAVASVLGLVGVVARRPAPVAAGALLLVALNGSFYALLLRRRGPSQAAAGIGLHALHHLVSAAALPAGALTHAGDKLSAAGTSRRASRTRPAAGPSSFAHRLA
jgi:GT2 family glycosyltransferase